MLGVFTSPVKVIAAFAIVLGWSFLQTVPVSAAQISRVVTTTADSGAGSLRQALLDANANATTAAAPHQITFNIPGGGVQTISLLSSLTGISQPTSIDASTQPGSSCGNLVPSIPATSNTPHTLMIELTSRSLATGSHTITFNQTAGNSTIKGLVINGAVAPYSNLSVQSADTHITCNYIGMEEDGLTNLTQLSTNGISYEGRTADRLTVDNNLISGNGGTGIYGAAIYGDPRADVTINNNLIGVTANGNAALGNGRSGSGYGIYTRDNGSGTNINHNVVSASQTTNIALNKDTNLSITANIVGLGLDGMTALANPGSGISLTNTDGTAIIGGASAADRNIIGSHTQHGILISSALNLAIEGNYIGVASDGVTARSNNYGIIVQGATSSNVRVGGNSAGQRNVVAGNRSNGIFITGSAGATGTNNTVVGNYVGLGADGVTTVPNNGIGIQYTNYQNGLIENNLVIKNGNTGIGITSAHGTTARGNYIGVLPSGAVQGNTGSGIVLTTTNNAIIGGTTAAERNVIAGNTAHGISIVSSNTTNVKGNYIGVDSTGTTRAANSSNGINISGTTTGTVIGGTTADERNIISGNNGTGISLTNTTATSNNIITGNYIGVDINGAAITGASASGIGINGSSLNGTRIGGATVGEQNIISGNKQYGIQLSGANAGANVVIYGNLIGLNQNGSAVPNGIGIYTPSLSAPSGSLQIGGASAGQGNIISGNTNEGVRIGASVATTTYPIYVRGNKIGVASDGTTARPNGLNGVAVANGSRQVIVGGIGAGEGNIIAYNSQNGVQVADAATTNITVRGNSIFGNNWRGIDLDGTLNAIDRIDLSDSDTGSNELQNYPRRTTITKCDGSTEVRTVLRSLPNTTYIIDFYANPSGHDPSGYGEGEQYLSSATVATNSNGYAEITPPAATNLSMTATSPDGSTSEYGNERAISISSCAITPTITNDTTPALAGDVTTTSFDAAIQPTAKVTVSSQTVSGSIASPSWSLADNTLTALSAGVYDVTTTFTDQETTMYSSVTRVGALTIDTTSPTVDIVRKSGQARYTNSNSAWFVATLSEPASSGSLTASDIELGTTTGTVTTFTKIDDTHYEFEVTGMSSGDTITATIPAAVFVDAAGNNNDVSTGTPNNQVTYDTAAPLLFAVNVDVTGSYTLNSPRITWTTTDTESGIDHYEISYDDGAFTTVTSPQTPTLAVQASHKIVVRAYDRAGNMREKTVQYPPVVVITAPTTISNNAITDTTIQIQGPLGMVITDVSISGAGSSGFVCTPIPSSSSTVPINCTGGSITTSGTLTVTATSDGGVVTGNSQDYIIDNTAPTATIEQAAGQADPTNVDSARFRLTFSKPMNTSTVTNADITVSGPSGTVSDFTQIDSRTWDITVTGMTDGGTVSVSFGADKATDLAGNLNQASTSVDNQVIYDITRPNVTINQSAAQADPTNGNMVFVAEFDSAFDISTLTSDDIHLSGSSTASVISMVQVPDTWQWVITVSGALHGETVAATIPADSVNDDAGNTNPASTSTDNQITKDSVAPIVTIDQLVANSTKPAITGTVDDNAAVVTVTIDGVEYTATNNGDGTWTLPAGVISSDLTDGIYDIAVSARDSAGNSGTDSSTDELTIDTTTPNGTIDAPSPTATNSPELSGTIDDSSAEIVVTIDGHDFVATNNGDGTWTLTAGVISPALGVGSHAFTVTFSDAAGNQSTGSGSIEIQRADADAPSVSDVSWIGGRPTVTGSYDSANSQSLRVRVAGVWYKLGVDSQLTVDGDTWTLDLTDLSPPLAAGNYDVTVEITTRDGSLLTDTSTNELVILPVTIPSVITNPGAGVTLAGTGMTVWQMLALGLTALLFGKRLMKLDSKKSA